VVEVLSGNQPVEVVEDRRVDQRGDRSVLLGVTLTPIGGQPFPKVAVTLRHDGIETGYACLIHRDGAGAERVSRCARNEDGGDSITLPVSEPGDVHLEVFDRGAVRLAGAGRVQTAVFASVHGWDRAGTVVLATAGDFPDALAMAPVAGALDAPLLLTGPGELPPEVLDEVRRLGAGRVVLAGGPAALSPQLEAFLVSQGLQVERVGGADRIETAQRAAELLGSAPDGLAVLANGRSFPDALAISPIAARRGLPLYLTEPDGLSERTLDAMRAQGVRRVIVVGGDAVVSPDVVAQLERAGLSVEARLAGADRYATAAAVADWAVATGAPVSEALMATGVTFPDALAAGPLGGRTDRLLLLVDPGRTLEAQPTGDFLARTPGVRLLVGLGGTQALPGVAPEAWKAEDGARSDLARASTGTGPYCDLTGLSSTSNPQPWGAPRGEQPPPVLIGPAPRAAGAIGPWSRP